jgi:hypothetical protein
MLQLKGLFVLKKFAERKCHRQHPLHDLPGLPWSSHVGLFLFTVALPKEAKKGTAAATFRGIFSNKTLPMCTCLWLLVELCFFSSKFGH